MQSVNHFRIFLIFLRLGLTSFGGPVAHIGYFRDEFVRRRKWLSEDAFADLVALTQFLPGPASSQLNFAVGYMRGGLPGGVVAWCGFTLPSAFFLIACGYGVLAAGDVSAAAWIRGLKIASVAVVAKAVFEMGKKLCPDRTTRTVAALATCAMVSFQSPLAQVAVIVLGAAAGYFLIRPPLQPVGGKENPFLKGTTRRPLIWLGTFFGLLIALPILAAIFPAVRSIAYVDAFYRAGALVFGGGHVVLPLLEQGIVGPGWVSRETFLAGYGITQAVPGPLFTFSAFLGTVFVDGPNGFPGGLLCLVAIFLPSLLLTIGVLPYWNHLRSNIGAQAALAGTNAAVVGLLLAAFYDPVFTVGIRNGGDFAFLAIAFAALQFWKLPPWALVIASAAAGSVVFR